MTKEPGDWAALGTPGLSINLQTQFVKRSGNLQPIFVRLNTLSDVNGEMLKERF